MVLKSFLGQNVPARAFSDLGRKCICPTCCKAICTVFVVIPGQSKLMFGGSFLVTLRPTESQQKANTKSTLDAGLLSGEVWTIVNSLLHPLYAGIAGIAWMGSEPAGAQFGFDLLVSMAEPAKVQWVPLVVLLGLVADIVQKNLCFLHAMYRAKPCHHGGGIRMFGFARQQPTLAFRDQVQKVMFQEPAWLLFHHPRRWYLRQLFFTTLWGC